jgi:hypothetical protein
VGRVIVSAIVLASDTAAAIAAVEALELELTRAAGGAVTVRAAVARADSSTLWDAAAGNPRVIGG